MSNNPTIIMAVPRGRILGECKTLFKKSKLEPVEEIYSSNTSALQFLTSDKHVRMVRVRAFDVITYVAQGAAQIGICGEDILLEQPNNEIYAPINLNLGHCRISVAEPKSMLKSDNPASWSHIRIATKYPNITKRHFAKKGIVAECIKLHGAIELAPSLGMCPRIVDLVSTGNTLKANGLVEVEVLHHISSLIIVNRTAIKTGSSHLQDVIDRLRLATKTSNHNENIAKK